MDADLMRAHSSSIGKTSAGLTQNRWELGNGTLLISRPVTAGQSINGRRKTGVDRFEAAGKEDQSEVVTRSASKSEEVTDVEENAMNPELGGLAQNTRRLDDDYVSTLAMMKELRTSVCELQKAVLPFNDFMERFHGLNSKLLSAYDKECVRRDVKGCELVLDFMNEWEKQISGQTLLRRILVRATALKATAKEISKVQNEVNDFRKQAEKHLDWVSGRLSEIGFQNHDFILGVFKKAIEQEGEMLDELNFDAVRLPHDDKKCNIGRRASRGKGRRFADRRKAIAREILNPKRVVSVRELKDVKGNFEGLLERFEGVRKTLKSKALEKPKDEVNWFFDGPLPKKRIKDRDFCVVEAEAYITGIEFIESGIQKQIAKVDSLIGDASGSFTQEDYVRNCRFIEGWNCIVELTEITVSWLLQTAENNYGRAMDEVFLRLILGKAGLHRDVRPIRAIAKNIHLREERSANIATQKARRDLIELIGTLEAFTDRNAGSADIILKSDGLIEQPTFKVIPRKVVYSMGAAYFRKIVEERNKFLGQLLKSSSYSVDVETIARYRNAVKVYKNLFATAQERLTKSAIADQNLILKGIEWNDEEEAAS